MRDLVLTRCSLCRSGTTTAAAAATECCQLGVLKEHCYYDDYYGEGHEGRTIHEAGVATGEGEDHLRTITRAGATRARVRDARTITRARGGPRGRG
jgi:hypothetical protein